MKHTYKTSGTCAREINFEIEDGVIKNVSFVGGCNGNLKAISKLVEGKNAEEVASLLVGNTCGYKDHHRVGGSACIFCFADGR